jgi:hypothetical protein
LENNTFVASVYKRGLSTKSWAATETVVREPNWQQEWLSAQALLEGLAQADL